MKELQVVNFALIHQILRDRAPGGPVKENVDDRPTFCVDGLIFFMGCVLLMVQLFRQTLFVHDPLFFKVDYFHQFERVPILMCSVTFLSFYFYLYCFRS